jgi:hypothetical protein
VDSPSTEPKQLNLFEHTPEEMVKEFMTAFEANPDRELIQKLVIEEANEVREALAHLLKEIIDLSYVCTQGAVLGFDFGDAEIPELGGMAQAFDIFPRNVMLEAFKRVHRSNMSKLMDDGKPRRREDGKILKGPNYREPYLLDLI